MANVKISWICGGSIFLAIAAFDLGFAPLPYAENIIGVVQKYKVEKNESLLEIARKFDIGMNGIIDANPGVDPIIPEAGREVDIPTAWILPDVPVRSGIVINIPEYRLFFFTPGNAGDVLTFPIGVGDQGKETPTGTYKVIEKIVNPAWYVPASIRKERPELPKVMPPGPDNPMGSHAMRLSLRTMLIHGTDRPWGIGTRSSHGCLRLYPEDIVRLFDLVPLGTRVTIVNQPLKVALKQDKVFMEVHRYADEITIYSALRLLAVKNLLERVDTDKLIDALNGMKGIPVDVTR